MRQLNKEKNDEISRLSGALQTATTKIKELEE